MRLRTKFVLALGTIVATLLAVTSFSFYTTSRTRARVSSLTEATLAEIEQGGFLGKPLEIEGRWSDQEIFIAEEIESLPHPRRPKLRSELQVVDVGASTIQMLGRVIGIDETTEFDWEGSLQLEELLPGQRLEVSCEVMEDGSWRARKVRREGLKSSDKVKGVVTDIRMDGTLPDTLEIAGLPVLLTTIRSDHDTRTELRRVSLATRMNLLAQDCLLAGQRVARDADQSMLTRDGDFVQADEFLDESITDLRDMVLALESSRLADSAQDLEMAIWVDRIKQTVERTAEHATTLLGLRADDVAAASDYFARRFEPFLAEELQPTLHTFLLHAEESLIDEASEIAAQSARMTKVLLVTSGFAVLLAVFMASSLWKSISVPLSSLQVAAAQIGAGQFDSPMDVSSGDEFAELGRSMNDMASQLATTTVSLENLDDIFDSMASALFVVDRERRVLSSNSAALELLGYTQLAELEGVSFLQLLKRDDASDDAVHPETRLTRRDGSEVAVALAEAKLKGGGYVYAAQDMTDRLRMEAQLRVSLREKDLLLREIHHRVKNNLQVISSLLALQSTRITDPMTLSVFADCQSRIRSMALIHQQLYSSTDVASIDLAHYLEQLASALYRSQSLTKTKVRFQTELESAPISLDQALACGLILNELVTNAIKHAFTDREEGSIRIRTRRVSPSRVRMQVEDDGGGLDTKLLETVNTGLGTRLVRALVEQLRGTIESDGTAGLSCSIEFPLDEVTSS